MPEEEGSDLSQSAVPLTTVSINLPTFWTDSPEVWFIQAEAQFKVKRITTSRTKFNHCLTALPQDVAFQLLDLVRAPPATPYEALRSCLIQMNMLSDFQRYQALQSLPLLSDQRPSELMDKMLVLLPEDKKPGFFLWGLFMDRLPADIPAHLLSESISDPQRMALRADELWTMRGWSVPVQVLSEQFEDVYALPRRNSSTRSGTRGSVPRSPSCSLVPEEDRRTSSSGVCWYHRRWGDAASQCRAPCSRSGN